MSKRPLDQIRAQHFELHRRVVQLEAAIAGTLAPPTHDGRGDLARLRIQLEDLETALVEHFAVEEEGGYFSEVLEVAPRFSREVAQLEKNHTAFLVEVARLIQQTRDSRVAEELHAPLRGLLRAMREHEAAEDTIVREAFQRDLGGP